MGQHAVSEAKTRLSGLINRVLEGEGIVIARRGQPPLELKPVATAQGRRSKPEIMTKNELDWLRALRSISPQMRANVAAEIRRARDACEK
jgi:antitoxin (DNA-binding transcriptional repressor) of toxin-antitoxin stability system